MRIRYVAIVSAALLAVGITMVAPESAEARRCYSFKTSHNGTDAFHPDGAAGTAKDKLVYAVASWKQEKSFKRVRIGKIKTRCGEWYLNRGCPR
jgi:hypothetical protein